LLRGALSCKVHLGFMYGPRSTKKAMKVSMMVLLGQWATCRVRVQMIVSPSVEFELSPVSWLPGSASACQHNPKGLDTLFPACCVDCPCLGSWSFRSRWRGRGRFWPSSRPFVFVCIPNEAWSHHILHSLCVLCRFSFAVPALVCLLGTFAALVVLDVFYAPSNGPRTH
jgi:hypothetical protein